MPQTNFTTEDSLVKNNLSYLDIRKKRARTQGQWEPGHYRGKLGARRHRVGSSVAGGWSGYGGVAGDEVEPDSNEEEEGDGEDDEEEAE